MTQFQFWSGLLCGIVATVVAVQVIVPKAATADQASKEEDWLYELRTYVTPPGKLDALNARFRDHTMKLFEKHGMKNIMYWVATDQPNTLIYVIAHRNAEAATASWAAFREDPVWKRVAEETQRDGKLVEKVESVYMKATDYSPRHPALSQTP